MQAIQAAYIAEIPREEWLELRRQGIGGSDAASIMGLNHRSSPLAVYCEKKGLVSEKEDTEAMRQGRDLEEYVAQRFVEYMAAEGASKEVCKCDHLLRHPEYPWMQATVDRLIVGERAGLECKTTTDTSYDYAKNEIPPHYYVQCVHYLAVTGYDVWYLAVLVFGKGFYVIPVYRDESEISALIAEEKDFWEKYVIPGIMPPPIGCEIDGKILNHVNADVDPDEIAELYGLEETIRNYLSIKSQMRALKRDLDAYEQEILFKMRRAAVGTADGFTVRRTKRTRTSVDEKRLKEQFPEIYEQVKKTTEHITTSIKGDNVL